MCVDKVHLSRGGGKMVVVVVVVVVGVFGKRSQAKRR
jgi:hypothetical protein